MSYATFGQMLKWMEVPAGLTIKDNRDELVDMANRVRQHFYLLYESVPLFMDGAECFTVQRFPEDCNCSDYYEGITLPAYYEGIEAIWQNNVPIKMYDKWREYRDGIDQHCSCGPEIHDVEGYFPTELDLAPSGSKTYVKFKAEDASDVGKILIVRYKDKSGNHTEDEIKLGEQWIRTEREVLALDNRGGVVLPTDLCGGVSVADGNGRIISRYGPAETVPSYRRYKIEGVCCGDQVYAKMSRRYHPLFYDADVIETDNRLAIEEATRFLRFNSSSSVDVSYEQKAAVHAANAEKYLLGEKSRHRGKATISQMVTNHGPKNRSRIRRNRRR